MVIALRSNFKRCAVVFLALVLLATASGCKPAVPPPAPVAAPGPPGPIIYVRLWKVIGPGQFEPSETSGLGAGCRLTRIEIFSAGQRLINNLNGGLFGPRMNFQLEATNWSGVQFQVDPYLTDNQLALRESRSVGPLLNYMTATYSPPSTYMRSGPNGYEPVLNIFFCGNYSSGQQSSQYVEYGSTFWPGYVASDPLAIPFIFDENHPLAAHGFILINDDTAPFSSAPKRTTAALAPAGRPYVVARNVLEHEVTHFFGRFKSIEFDTESTYDVTGHDTNSTGTQRNTDGDFVKRRRHDANILKVLSHDQADIGVLPGVDASMCVLPLKVPGAINESNMNAPGRNEADIIWKRIMTGQGFQP